MSRPEDLARLKAFVARNVALGRCEACGKPRDTARFCRTHADLHNVRCRLYRKTREPLP